MIFVGNPDRGYFIEEFCLKKDIPFDYVEESMYIQDQVNDILALQHKDYVIFDVEQYTDDSSIIADWVWKICNSNTAKPIILASGYNTYASIISELASSGVKYFILSSTLSEMKDQLEKCVNGFYDANPIEFTNIENYVSSDKEAINTLNFQSIAVAGACGRIGTTTAAIQIVKYLNFYGKKACYIQMNSSNYMELVVKQFGTDYIDQELGYVSFEGIDHFYKTSKIKEIMQKGYDFYVYDYGNYFDNDFNRISFLEKGLQICVCGIDPFELRESTKLIDSVFYDGVNYMFNFVADVEKNEVLKLMGDKKDVTYFLPYAPNKYIYAPNDVFSRLLPLDGNVNHKILKKGKKKLFSLKKH